MTKFEIKQAFSKLKSAKEKESFLKSQNIKFTHDSFQNLIVWCSDEVLTLQPVRRTEK